MIYKVSILFLLFMIYSILGWLMEITYVSFCEKRFTYNRGVLIGPYCPIYGIGVITIILFLNKYYEDAFVLFIMATIVCSIIEYITSYLLEKVYNARWWDYSKKRYHINGRICLSNALAFGVASLVVMYVIHPFIINFLYTFNSNIIIIISSLLMIVFLIDNIITTQILLSLELNIISIKKDQTEEISQKIKNKLNKNFYLKKRLLNAFNFITEEKDNYINKIKKIINNINKDKKTKR